MAKPKFSKRFTDAGDFTACRAAEAWCEARGIAVGWMQRPDPRGLLLGDFVVSKWRNLNAKERSELDGTMTGDMRHGPVTVTLNGAEADYPVLSAERAT
jgi:hypothetical protein